MTKEVTKKEEYALSKEDAQILGAADEVTASDLSISRLAVMQPLSDLVKDDQARAGSIVDIDTGEELAFKDEKPLHVIIVKSHKYWVEKRGDEFVGKYPAVHDKELPWEEGDLKRMYHHAFYVLLPHEVEQGIEMPYEIAFKSTDLATARKISKMLITLKRQGKASWSRVFDITVAKKEKGKHSWFGTDVKAGNETSVKEVHAALSWFKQLSNIDLNSIPAEGTDTPSSAGSSNRDDLEIPF